MPPDPGGIFAAVDNCSHPNEILFQGVIDSEREALGECALNVLVSFPMNSSVEFQGIDIGEKGIEELTAQSLFAIFIKREPFDEIPHGEIKDFNPHEIPLRSCFLAVSQSMKWALPSTTKRCLSSRMVLCHSGTSSSASASAMPSHNASIARSFS